MSQCRLKEQLLLFIGRLVLQGRDEHGVVKTELYVQYPNISYMFLGQSFMLKTYRSRLIVQKVGNLSVSLVPVVFTDEKKKKVFLSIHGILWISIIDFSNALPNKFDETLVFPERRGNSFFAAFKVAVGLVKSGLVLNDFEDLVHFVEPLLGIHEL